ncbi:hypothetical protein C8Q73DRAFT_293946 [Cubamyces lactineus]|nr:hypothetical protein C8Q73DRAFT_293946 [Cubamyces lactineus]
MRWWRCLCEKAGVWRLYGTSRCWPLLVPRAAERVLFLSTSDIPHVSGLWLRCCLLWGKQTVPSTLGSEFWRRRCRKWRPGAGGSRCRIPASPRLAPAAVHSLNAACLCVKTGLLFYSVLLLCTTAAHWYLTTSIWRTPLARPPAGLAHLSTVPKLQYLGRIVFRHLGRLLVGAFPEKNAPQQGASRRFQPSYTTVPPERPLHHASLLLLCTSSGTRR